MFLFGISRAAKFSEEIVQMKKSGKVSVEQLSSLAPFGWKGLERYQHSNSISAWKERFGKVSTQHQSSQFKGFSAEALFEESEQFARFGKVISRGAKFPGGSVQISWEIFLWRSILWRKCTFGEVWKGVS